MPEHITRRETVRRGLAATSLLALLPEWALPALAQGETLVPFTDLPANFNPTPSARPAHARHPQDRRSVHAEGSVLHHAALRPSRSRPGNVSPQGLRAGGAAEVVLARRAAEDAQHGTGRRVRVLGQSPSAAGPVRATAAGPASR